MRTAGLVALAAAIGVPSVRAATFLVDTTADAGPGSLRQAVIDANAASGADTITFAIATAGIPRISLATPLPSLTGPVTIDGTTQAPAGWVELDGQATSSAVGIILAGGSSTVRRLVINGFDHAGIQMTGAGLNVVQGNRIGTNTAGSQALSPLAYGIEISGSPANQIGGTTAGAGNLISGNLFGIFIHGSAAAGNVIQGNLIGTNASGSAALPNTSTGIWIFGVKETVIGGVDPAAGNVIAGNSTDGIDLAGSGTVDTIVAGNAIGVGVDLVTPIGNGQDGIFVSGGAGRTSIGSVAANWIATNGGAGVRLPAGVRNAVRGNVIVDNGGLGIDLGPAGVTANDALDLDSGANNLQNFPVLDAAFAGGTSVSGTLDGAANGSFVVEVFSTVDCDASGYGEGDELLGTAGVSTNLLGHADFTVMLSRAVDASSEYLTATATDDLGNTSEFSACTAAVLLPTTTTTTTSSTTTTTTGGAGTSTTTISAPATTTTTTATSSTTTTTGAGGTSTTTTTAAASSSTTTTGPGSSTTTTTSASGTSTTTTTAPAPTTTTSVPGTTSTTSATSSTTSTTAPGGTTTTTMPSPAATSTTTSSTTTTTPDGASTTTTTGADGSTTSTTGVAGSSTSTTTAPTTTTMSGPTTTSTTLPGSCPGPGCGCVVEPTFDSIRCRLGLLDETVTAMPELEPLRERVGRRVRQAGLLLERAQARCAASHRGPARRKLQKARRSLVRMLRTVRASRTRRTALPEALESLAGTTTLLVSDTRTLAHGLTCR